MAEKRLSDFCTTNGNIDKSDYLKNIFTLSELEFFADASRLLVKDDQFSEEAKKVFEEAVSVFENAMTSNNEPTTCYLLPATYSTPFLRSLNNVKHLLLAETGKYLADWDFVITDGGVSFGAMLNSKKRRIFKGMWVYLEDIRSPFNVGAMFRTAESFGVEKIILSPFCADPRHKRAERTAMGCIDVVPWERQELFAPLSKNEPLVDLLLPVFALETGGTPINEFKFPECGILIAGSEELGVSPRALEAADSSLGRVSIPIYGAKASLNVSTAFGIALQAWALYLR